MPYSMLTPAPLDEITEKINNKTNNKTNNKSTNKTIKNKSTKFSDIIENNIIHKKEYNKSNLSEGYKNNYLTSDDEEENFSNFEKINNDRNKPESIKDKEPYIDYNNNGYENFDYENINNNNFGNYDNNYTLNNNEFNKHLNTSNRTVHDYSNISQNNIDNISNKELLTKINYIIHLLEEQRSEKTNYVTEELILYLFLGVFIIFVLDSFTKMSKYIR